MYAKAIFVEGKVVTGLHHGEAYSLLTDEEKSSESLVSGFWDEKTGRFFSEECEFYTKRMYLVRHSQPSRSYDVDPDPDLCPEGIDKAHRTAHYLKSQDLSHFRGYTSPLLRCLITADIISRVTGLMFQVDPLFAEPTQQMPVIANHAHDFPQFRWPSSSPFRCEMENRNEFSARLGKVVKELPVESVVVSHGDTILNLAKVVSGQHPEGIVAPASVTFIENNEVIHVGKQI